jgi:hypothetical protein
VAHESAVIQLAADGALVIESASTLPIGVTLVITANGVANAGTLERPLSVDLTDLLPRTATPGGVDYPFLSRSIRPAVSRKRMSTDTTRS